MTQLKIPAVYMRGGTSKGVFFLRDVLPVDVPQRDQLLLRVVGSPDPFGKQIDGMGGATSSTSKVVIISKSARPDCDVDYLFGAVPINAPAIDWSGNCGNLVSAVGPFAITEKLVAAPRDGVAVVRIWQVNTSKRIIAHVPMKGGAVSEDGDFQLDGVAFPGAEIKLEFIEPGGSAGEGEGALFPTGQTIDVLEIPNVGPMRATLINAGNPMVLIEAASLGLHGDELQNRVNSNAELLRRCESIRAHGAVAMGLAKTPAEASAIRPATPKLAFIAAPSDYTASSGKRIRGAEFNVHMRTLSMGSLHHAIPGTAAIALAVAAKIPGTVVHEMITPGATELRIGHPSGTMSAAADVESRDGNWVVTKVAMSRSARRLMEGWVLAPSSWRFPT